MVAVFSFFKIPEGRQKSRGLLSEPVREMFIENKMGNWCDPAGVVFSATVFSLQTYEPPGFGFSI